MRNNRGQYRGMLHWLWLSVVVLMLDQVSKFAVVAMMELYETIELTPFFQLTYVRNQGAAFSFLSEAGGWQRWFFILLSIVASISIIVWMTRLGAHERFNAIALSMILGGAIGNLIDRISHGFVIDFLDVFYGDWHWPAFNVADSGITIGVIMLLLDSMRSQEKSV